jgi:hypothetical protein
MTKPFHVRYTCENCGHQTSAETGFGRWMRHCPKLQPSVAHIVRTDTDHTILRYMTYLQGAKTRDYQLIMDVEVKEFGAEPDRAQADILNFKHQLVTNKSKNRHGAKTDNTYELRSSAAGRKVKVRYLGFHLLQFEKTSPNDSRWIKWDRKEITLDTLVGLLALDLHPDKPHMRMADFLRDRHKQRQAPSLFEVDHRKPAVRS